MIRGWPLYLAAVISMGCYPSYEIVQRDAPIPAKPWNLKELNSAYDDRNAAVPPSLQTRTDILFSTARAREGADLDLLAGHIFVEFGQWNAEYYQSARVEPDSEVAKALNHPGANERGPQILASEDEHEVPHNLYVFASDRAGSYDVYALLGPPTWVNSSSEDKAAWGKVGEPAPIPGLNDPERYEAYLSPWGEDRVLYATDRGPEGTLEIYAAQLREPNKLQAGVHEHARVDALCSPANDSFPYVNGNEIVFASDREGGFGGYDLYRARWDGERWSEPENLGPAINSEHDERRPVLIRAEEFESDLLLFSSDRPGGLGGFDLYGVGLPRLEGDRSEPGDAATPPR